MTSRPSSAALVVCSLLLAACEVPPSEEAEVAPSETPADAVAEAAADTAEREPLPADSAIIRLDASDPNLGVWGTATSPGIRLGNPDPSRSDPSSPSSGCRSRARPRTSSLARSKSPLWGLR